MTEPDIRMRNAAVGAAGRRFSALIIAVLFAAVLMTAGCAQKGPILLENVLYQAPEGTAAGAHTLVVGVSPILDARGKAASVIGQRTIRDFVQNEYTVDGTAAAVVTAALKDALQARGITVKDAPAWDLNEGSLPAGGYDILLGGEVKTLWVDAVSQPLNVKMKAAVQLRVVAAKEKKTVRTLTLNSSQEQETMAYSDYAVRDLLASALSAAIDQLLKDDEIQQLLR